VVDRNLPPSEDELSDQKGEPPIGMLPNGKLLEATDDYLEETTLPGELPSE
jgi:hypothetical protein